MFWDGVDGFIVYTLLFYHHKSGQIFHPWSILLTSYSHYYDDRTLWLIDWTTLISTYNMCASYFAFIWSEILTRPAFLRLITMIFHSTLNQQCSYFVFVLEKTRPHLRPLNGPVIIYQYHTRGASFVPQYVKKYHLTDDSCNLSLRSNIFFCQKVYAIINLLKYQ